MEWLNTYYNRGYKAKCITLVWTCTKSGGKQISLKNVKYDFGNKKADC